MSQTCLQCSAPFEILPEDLALLDRLSPIIGGKKEALPPPTLCPDCRKQRRLTLRNERKLYHRKCDLTGKQIISIHSPEQPVKVYRHQEWWSDAWDALSHGRAFDFSKPFFPQFSKLYRAVPHMNVIGEDNENSDYCNLTANLRNCYLVFESSNDEDCLYGYWLQKCNDCSDVSFSHECRHCHAIDDCYNCHGLRWSWHCTNCADSAFLFDCIGCRNCLFCANLRQKEYCILNEQFTKEEYEKKLRECPMDSAKSVEAMQKTFDRFLLRQPHRALQHVNVERCTGDFLQESRDCHECYHAHQAEDCRYGEHVWRQSRSNMDVSTVGRDAELCYECLNTGIGSKSDCFCMQCWAGTSNLLYCAECFSCHDCFGCVGLRHKQYCVLNKQYSKEEYESLVPKIIEHMRKTHEWGEFFPVTVSLFAYNETVAQEQFPLTKEAVIERGWQWKEDETPVQDQYLGPAVTIPDRIADVTDDLCQRVLRCAVTGKPYKIIPQELRFYREMGLPVPHLCPDARHEARMRNRNPQKLWDRQCGKCGKAIKTTYAPDRPEMVYCEQCYLQTVY
jgi:hypothetical protein